MSHVIIKQDATGNRQFFTLTHKWSAEYPDGWKYANETHAMIEMRKRWPVGSPDWQQVRVIDTADI